MGCTRRGGWEVTNVARTKRVRRRLEAVELFPELAQLAMEGFTPRSWDDYPKVREWASRQVFHTTEATLRHKFNETASVIRSIQEE